ncbi:hypothetical protein ACU4GR_31645 [Methylobacterium oryzae CBMB20]
MSSFWLIAWAAVLVVSFMTKTTNDYSRHGLARDLRRRACRSWWRARAAVQAAACASG